MLRVDFSFVVLYIFIFIFFLLPTNTCWSWEKQARYTCNLSFFIRACRVLLYTKASEYLLSKARTCVHCSDSNSETLFSAPQPSPCRLSSSATEPGLCHLDTLCCLSKIPGLLYWHSLQYIPARPDKVKTESLSGHHGVFSNKSIWEMICRAK